MRARRKRRSRETLGPVHERLAVDPPRNAVVARAAVEDPYEPGTHITVLRSIRDDPLARLRARNQIDEAQYKAGRAWQADYEAAEIGLMHSIDTTVTAVDGSRRIREPITDRRRNAIQRLARDSRVLGQLAESVVRDVLGRGLMIDRVAASRGHPDERSRYFYGRVFREALEALARARGLAG